MCYKAIGLPKISKATINREQAKELASVKKFKTCPNLCFRNGIFKPVAVDLKYGKKHSGINNVCIHTKNNAPLTGIIPPRKLLFITYFTRNAKDLSPLKQVAICIGKSQVGTGKIIGFGHSLQLCSNCHFLHWRQEYHSSQIT